jgi:hypothetical protein
MTEEFDFRQTQKRAKDFSDISFEEGLFCNICGEPRSYVETTEAIGFGLYRKVWLCEDCDVAPAGYPT